MQQKMAGSTFFNKNNSRRTRAVLIGAIAFIAAIGLAWASLSARDENNAGETMQRVPVVAFAVGSSGDGETIEISGTSRAASSSTIRFQVGGDVVVKHVRLGQQVAAGDVLFTLDNPEVAPMKSRALQSRNRLALAFEQGQRDFERLDELYKEGAATKQEWELASTAVRSNEAALKEAEAELSRTERLAAELKLSAPFSGVVTALMVDIGDVVTAGTNALQLVDPTQVEVELAVNDSVLSSVKVDQQVLVSLGSNGLDKTVNGKVKDISPYRSAGALPTLLISLPSEEVRPGMPLKASLPLRAKDGLAIPVEAVIMTGEDSVAVFRIEDERAKLVPTRAIRISGNTVVVEGGLAAGDKIVTAGLSKLYNGAPVEIVKAQ